MIIVTCEKITDCGVRAEIHRVAWAGAQQSSGSYPKNAQAHAIGLESHGPAVCLHGVHLGTPESGLWLPQKRSWLSGGPLTTTYGLGACWCDLFRKTSTDCGPPPITGAYELALEEMDQKLHRPRSTRPVEEREERRVRGERVREENPAKECFFQRGFEIPWLTPNYGVRGPVFAALPIISVNRFPV